MSPVGKNTRIRTSQYWEVREYGFPCWPGYTYGPTRAMINCRTWQSELEMDGVLWWKNRKGSKCTSIRSQFDKKWWPAGHISDSGSVVMGDLGGNVNACNAKMFPCSKCTIFCSLRRVNLSGNSKNWKNSIQQVVEAKETSKGAQERALNQYVED